MEAKREKTGMFFFPSGSDIQPCLEMHGVQLLRSGRRGQMFSQGDSPVLLLFPQLFLLSVMSPGIEYE